MGNVIIMLSAAFFRASGAIRNTAMRNVRFSSSLAGRDMSGFSESISVHASVEELESTLESSTSGRVVVKNPMGKVAGSLTKEDLAHATRDNGTIIGSRGALRREDSMVADLVGDATNKAAAPLDLNGEQLRESIDMP